MSNDLQQNTIQELREINHLMYLRPSNGSLIDKRTYKSYNFTNGTYSMGRTAQCIINSGGDFVWGPSSYLKVKFAKGAGTIGLGNILNIFKNVRLTHRSGEVLEYIQDYNVLGRILSKYVVSNDDKTKIDSLLSVPAAAATYVCCVPLWMLMGVFNVDQSFIPGGFLAGAKLEIDLESNDVAFATDSANGVTADSLEFNLVLDSAQVYDDVQKQILEEQADVAGSGIQFNYSTYFSSHTTESSANVNFDIQQSASITELVCAGIREADKIKANEESFSFKPQGEQYQFRLGSQYFPQQPVRDLTETEQTESYMNTLVAFESAPHQYMGVPANNSGSSVTTATFIAGDAIYATTLEKSASGLALSGEPTNNSRILNLELTKTAVSDRVDVFLKYVRTANIMGSNLVVDR
jgi:hypothetical protein